MDLGGRSGGEERRHTTFDLELFVVEALSFERPIALAVYAKAGACNSRPRRADVAERLEALDQQTLDVRQKL